MPTPPNVASILKEALDAVSAAGIPPELQPLAFEKAVDLFAGTGRPAPTIEKPEKKNAGRLNGGSDSGSERGPTADSTPLGRLADRLSLNPETIGEVFDHDSDGLRIVVGTTK